MIDLFLKGGPLMWPLLLLSIVSVAVILEREVFFLKNSVRISLLEELKQKIQTGKREDAFEMVSGTNRSVLSFINIIFSTSDKPLEKAEKEISLSGDKILFSASKYIHILELIGSIAPLIGLSGTVIGLVQVFREIGINTSTQIDASLMAGGIWIAMITTVAGLFTAIPSLFFAHINRNRIKKLAFNMKIYGEEINTLLRETEPSEQ